MIISIYQANGSETTGLFLQFPQIDTTPRGESRHKTHDQIHAVYHNCSFYWHHPGFVLAWIGFWKKHYKKIVVWRITYFLLTFFLVNQFDKKQTGLAF